MSEPMSLLGIADFLRSKCCFERQRYGSCNCQKRSNRSVNPCQVTSDLADQCERGENLEEVLKRVAIHRCFYRNCNHKGCIKTEAVMESLLEIIHRKRAA